MPELVQNRFTSWKLTPDEERIGHALHNLNICVLQNLLADVSENLINAKLDPQNPMQYALDKENAQGRIAVIQWLIDRSHWAHSAQAMEETQAMTDASQDRKVD